MEAEFRAGWEWGGARWAALVGEASPEMGRGHLSLGVSESSFPLLGGPSRWCISHLSSDQVPNRHFPLVLASPTGSQQPLPKNTLKPTYWLCTLNCPPLALKPSDPPPSRFSPPPPLSVPASPLLLRSQSPFQIPPHPHQYRPQPLLWASAPDPPPLTPKPLSLLCQSWLLSPVFISVGSGCGRGVPGAYRRLCTVAVPSACACVPCRGRVECIVQHIFMNKIVLNISRALG